MAPARKFMGGVRRSALGACLRSAAPFKSENVIIAAHLEDREGSLWVATEFGLSRRLPDGRMIHYDVFDDSLLEDREGRLARRSLSKAGGYLLTPQRRELSILDANNNGAV